MVLKKSAGILVYRYQNKKLEVLLCHMGGPYWTGIDKGGWSLPKGELKNEKAIDAAIREFQEETGFIIEKENLRFLGTKKQPSRKLVVVFCGTGDYDPSLFFSNTFKKEWPKGSGKIVEFPEMDKVEWIEIQDAKEKR